MRLCGACAAVAMVGTAAFAGTVPRQTLVPSASVLVLSPMVRIDTVDPRLAQPAGGELRALVRSRVPWEISLSRRVGGPAFANAGGSPSAAGAASGPPADELSVRTASGLTCRVPASGPVSVAAGGPTPAEGTVVSVLLAANVKLDSPPGARQAWFDVLLNGKPAGAGAALSYDVPHVLDLVPDARPFQLAKAPDPTRPGTWPFEKRTYRVVSNVPWVVEVALNAAPTESVAGRALRQNAMVVLGAGQVKAPLVPGQPVAVASGDATGGDGTGVDVELGLVVSGGEIEGAYSTAVSVTARPAAATNPVSAMRTSGGETPVRERLP